MALVSCGGRSLNCSDSFWENVPITADPDIAGIGVSRLAISEHHPISNYALDTRRHIHYLVDCIRLSLYHSLT